MTIESTSASVASVTDLDTNAEYSFQVLAYTVHDGPLSKEMKTRTKEESKSC